MWGGCGVDVEGEIVKRVGVCVCGEFEGVVDVRRGDGVRIGGAVVRVRVVEKSVVNGV